MSNADAATHDVAGLLAEIRNARFNAGLRCVRCESPNVVRWGSFAGRQRYRCRACRRTFSDLTSTPAAYAKRLALLPAYRTCLQQCLSVRASAHAIGVHPTTAFRWRHRYLDAMLVLEQTLLTGLVELAESFVLCTDTVRVRGRRRRLSDFRERRSWISAMRDRSGRSRMFHVGEWRGAIWEEMIDTMAPDAVAFIGRAGRYSAAGRVAAAHGIPYLRVAGPHRRNPSARLLHVHAASAMIADFRRWLRRFRGVKSRYLDNYVFWYGTLDPDRRTDWRLDRLLCWPLAPDNF